jgi:NhaA family Na+:H+ antiporter
MSDIKDINPTKIDQWVINPVNRFITKSTTGGIVLFASAVLALILANSPLKDWFHNLWEHELGLSIDKFSYKATLHHWINDGLMAVFFFVVGLELKHEVVGGQLRSLKDASLPIFAAVGGMIVPALIFLAFNPTGHAQNGWGIPMATDIAFALGVVYMLGNKVPPSLKIFLTTLAIADDLGAVLVIAIFYTSDISLLSLGIGFLFLAILILANYLGVRNTVFYGIMGIGGLWVAFLASGVHATIAGVLAAFTIPANVKINEESFLLKIKRLTKKFERANPNGLPTVTKEQLHILEDIDTIARRATTPLQKLEHGMHPLVSFIIMPLFALSNAGVTLGIDVIDTMFSPVALGVFFGLFAGKLIGVYGFSWLFVKLKIGKMPHQMTKRHLLGVSFLASIGFTMSLFIANLAFNDPIYIQEAKIGILLASILAGLVGFLFLNYNAKSYRQTKNTGMI